MPAPLTDQQIALYMPKRRSGSRQQAAAAAGISLSSAQQIDAGRLQPRAAQPQQGRQPDPLADVWEPLLLPLLEWHPGLTPTTLLEQLQEQKPDQDRNSCKRTLRWVPFIGQPWPLKSLTSGGRVRVGFQCKRHRESFLQVSCVALDGSNSTGSRPG
jgi:hypothetical protein